MEHSWLIVIDATAALGGPRLDTARQTAIRSNAVADDLPKVLRMGERMAKFQIGQVVKHRVFPFRGVIFDVDPVFNNTEEWYQAIPESIRPRKDQPFYHLLAENEESYYVAYVSEQNLLVDETGEPVDHPQVHDMFGRLQNGIYLEWRSHHPN
jgi:heat shock protein HspQ